MLWRSVSVRGCLGLLLKYRLSKYMSFTFYIEKRWLSLSNDYLLVVDDHFGVRQLMCEFLYREGFRVKEAADGHTALQIVSEEKPKLTFLDLKMPGLSGMETLNKLQQIHPHTQVVVMSGYTQDNTLTSAVQDGLVKHFLPKPFDLDNLRLILPSLLSNPWESSN